MENNNENKGFQYTYSAREQEELRRLRAKYTGKPENKMERLRRLDARVTQKAQAISLVFGVIGALVLGLGMSLVMSDLALMLGLPDSMAMLCGVLIGLFGGVLVSLAYPVYQWVTKRERKRIAPEVIRLADELLK